MYEYNAKVKRVVDGDTVDAYIDLGFDVSKSIRIRLKGIDTPESRTRDLVEKRYGLGAKHRMVELLENNGNEFVIKSHGVGKYGRCLGELFDKHGRSINIMMQEEGHAIPYFGGSKEEIKQKFIDAREISSPYVDKQIKPLD